MNVTDKVVNLNANKIVFMDVYKDADAPYTDFRPDEKIDLITGAGAIDARMVMSPTYVGALNKIMIELQRKCYEIYGKKYMTLHEMTAYFDSK